MMRFTTFKQVRKHEISFDQMIEHVRNVVDNDPRISEKAKQLYQTMLAINNQATVNDQINYMSLMNRIDNDEPSNSKNMGIRNRYHPSSNTSSRMSYSTFTQSEPAKVLNKTNEESNFISHMVKTYLHTLLGPIGLLLSVPAAAALPSGLAIQTGSGGGQDLCSGMVWCIQAVLKNITDNSVVAQFSRDFGLTSSQGSFVTEIALGTCFDESKLTGIINTVLDAVPSDWHSSTPTSCSATSSIWNNVQTTGSATQLSTNGCTQFQNALSNAAASCYNADTGARVFGIGLGIAVAAAVLVGAVACCAYKHRNRFS